MAGKTMRTETVLKALRAERRTMSRIAEEAPAGAMRERALGALASIKEIAYQLGLTDEMNAPTGEYEAEEVTVKG